MTFFPVNKDYQDPDFYCRKFAEIESFPDKLGANLSLMTAHAKEQGNIRVISKGALDWIKKDRAALDKGKAQQLLKILQAIKLGEEEFVGTNVPRRVSSVVLSLFNDPYAYMAQAERILQNIYLEGNIAEDIQNEDFGDIKLFVKDGYLNQIAHVVSEKMENVRDLAEMQKLQKVMIEARKEETKLQGKNFFRRFICWLRNSNKEFDRVYRAATAKVIEFKIAREVAEFEKWNDFGVKLLHILRRLEDPLLEREVKKALYDSLNAYRETRGAAATSDQIELIGRIYQAAHDNALISR